MAADRVPFRALQFFLAYPRWYLKGRGVHFSPEVRAFHKLIDRTIHARVALGPQPRWVSGQGWREPKRGAKVSSLLAPRERERLVGSGIADSTVRSLSQAGWKLTPKASFRERSPAEWAKLLGDLPDDARAALQPVVDDLLKSRGVEWVLCLACGRRYAPRVRKNLSCISCLTYLTPQQRWWKIRKRRKNVVPLT